MGLIIKVGDTLLVKKVLRLKDQWEVLEDITDRQSYDIRKWALLTMHSVEWGESEHGGPAIGDMEIYFVEAGEKETCGFMADNLRDLINEGIIEKVVG